MRALPFAMAVLLTAGNGCQIAGPGNDDAELDSLERQILALIGDAPASNVSACKAIAFGSKPCGGPWSYLVYSAEHTDEAELARLVESYNALQRQINRDRGLVSDCEIIGPPQIALENASCRAASVDAGSRD